ncbi:MAG: hypothetical protein GY798_29655 [Hyphomicrobiales bacterium]|nr:hypothetical protein [Hyphomicrobiales bacterium]
MALKTVPSLLIQGIGSHVGKSVIITGLYRARKRRDLWGVPFEPQTEVGV